MKDVEFSRLLSDLDETAKKLNQASGSVNDIIKRFQEMLRSMNLGLSVWPVTLNSTTWMEEDSDVEECERGSMRHELGFTKHNNDWILATRTAYYGRGTLGFARP